jgi:SAM-dependent methyltransferase
MSTENIEKFITELARSLHENTFVKMTLGNYKGADQHLQKILVRPVETKKGVRLFFLFRYDMRDTAKNFDFNESLKKVRQMLGTEFFAGHLFTTVNDFQLDIGKKGKSRLNAAKPTFKQKISTAHNREKKVLVNPNSFYLQALGITTDKGEIREKQQDKWKQINKFIETVAKLFENSTLKDRNKIKIVDMGSGKGYLTFALYDYFNNVKQIKPEVIGVDLKSELIGLCNDIAKSAEFSDLHFVHGSINDFNLTEVDILIALHACNTATDEAIFQGIKAEAKLIICSPCCHQEIRPQMKPPKLLKDIFKHGVMLEREAEIITDGLRALLLERSGYSSKIFEFISTEHTPKNNMLVGTRHEKEIDIARFNREIAEIKEFYGIEDQRLESLLIENREQINL